MMLSTLFASARSSPQLSSFSVRCLSCSAVVQGKHKKGHFRLKKATKGDRSNELAVLPDWSHTDGTPAPQGLHKNCNMELQRQICRRIILFLDEMNQAKQKTL